MKQRYGFADVFSMNTGLIIWIRLFVYAQRKEELAHRMDKLDYLDDAAMNMAEVMGTTGMYKKRWNYWGRLIRKRCPIISMFTIITCIALFTD